MFEEEDFVGVNGWGFVGGEVVDFFVVGFGVGGEDWVFWVGYFEL